MKNLYLKLRMADIHSGLLEGHLSVSLMFIFGVLHNKSHNQGLKYGTVKSAVP